MRKSIYQQFEEKIALAICDQDERSEWTILGHGSLGLSEAQSSQHSINTVVAPLDVGSVKLEKSFIIPMPVGAVEVLRLRQTWFQGVLNSENRRSEQVEEREVYLSTSTFEQVELTDLWEIKDFHNPALKELAGTKYLVFNAQFGHRTIRLNVPCTEIFRFYFSPTTNFALAALSGHIAEKSLYNPRNRDASSEQAAKWGVPCVTLRKSIEDITAPYVARVATCSYAEESFNNIYSDVFHSPNANPGKYMFCTPPLDQDTCWHVDGVAVGSEFFVCQIKACFGRFPFDRVFFDRDNNTSGLRSKPPEEEVKLRQENPEFIENGEGDKPDLIDGAPPTVSVATVTLEGSFEKPMFPDLRDVPVQKVVKAVLEDETTRTVKVITGQALIEYVTTAAASGKVNNQNIGQIKIQQSGIISDDKPNFKEVVSIFEVVISLNSYLERANLGKANLRIYKGMRHSKSKVASVVPYYEYKDPLICFTETRNLDKYFESERDSYYLRPMAFVVIEYKDLFFYMVEFLAADGISYDGKSTLFFSELSPEFNEELVEYELKKLDEFGGRSWSRKTIDAKPEPSSKVAHRFKHNPKSDVSRKVDSILKQLC